MSNLREVVLTSAVRTPIGSFLGSLSSISGPKLGSIVVKEALERSGLQPEQVDEVIMGNVLSAGMGQAPARQAAIYAGLPPSVECITINKMCGSGLKAVMLAAQAISTGDADIIIAGGLESMSNAPYYLPDYRKGGRMGHGKVVDGMIMDGLWDVYRDMHMGHCGEICAREFNFTREKQDQYAITSYKRALKAIQEGAFKEEIVPVEVPQRKGEPVVVSEDEEPGRVNFEKLPKLRPAFDREGTITAANASKINDGAAALVVMSAEKAQELNIKPLVRIISQASYAQEPEWFTTAPAKAIKKALDKAGMSLNEIDLFEINEAFSVVAMAAIEELGLDPEKVNVNGGAVALGHPIGASGARILTTLIYSMQKRNLRKGIASICIGGGEASTLIVERI